MVNHTPLKQKLLVACHAYVDNRLAASKEAMNQAQQSANEEGKSSAGDKYETGRAMAQIERDKAAQQVEEALKLKRALTQIDPDLKSEQGALGSIIIASNVSVFLSIGAGKLVIEGRNFVAVGPLAPLGKVLLGRRVNEEFEFNGQRNKILEIL